MSSLDALIRRIRGEYKEMPGLCLTFDQACRLWQIDPATCRLVLDALLQEQFLARSLDGSFMVREIEPPRRGGLKAAFRTAALPRQRRA